MEVITIERPYTRNVCALPFIPGHTPRVILLRHETEYGEFIYDGFGGVNTQLPTDMMAGPKSCSEYIYRGLDVIVKPEQWEEIVTLKGEDWEVSFYFVILEAFRKAEAQIRNHTISREDAYGGLPLNTVSSIRWLVPLALDENVVKPLGLSGISI